MSMLPPFNERGLLPPGDYSLTFAQLHNSILGSAGEEEWDGEWRHYLLGQAEVLIRQLWEVGIDKIFLDGSFVEDKAHPNDIDGYFVCDVREFASGNLERQLNTLDPHKIWTWDPAARRRYRNYTKKQLPMWHHYRVELYPHFGQSSGIVDQFGNELQFPSAFRTQRATDEQKGIIKVLKEGGPS